MSVLAQVTDALSAFNRFVEAQVEKARRDARFAAELRRQWKKIRSEIATVETPTGDYRLLFAGETTRPYSLALANRSNMR